MQDLTGLPVEKLSNITILDLHVARSHLSSAGGDTPRASLVFNMVMLKLPGQTIDLLVYPVTISLGVSCPVASMRRLGKCSEQLKLWSNN